MAPGLLYPLAMIRSILRSLRWRYVVIVGCVVVAALGGYAYSHHSEVNAGTDPAIQPVSRESTGVWLVDLRSALTQARARHKDVLLHFSPPAHRASATLQSAAAVLDSETLRRCLGESFVLVRMAPPSSASSPGNVTEVTTWAQKLGVASFPTFVLLDVQAKPYAKTELVATSAEKYQDEFRRLQKIRTNRDQALTQAGAVQGLERAKYLDKALAEVATFADSEYSDIERKIVDLDSQNAAGLKAKYESTVVTREIDSVIQSEVYPLADRGNYRAAVARIDRLIGELKPPRPQLQLLTAFKGQLYFSLGDKRRGTQVLDEAIAIDPQSESAARARAAKVQLMGAS
jgi:hypothetical protein